MRLVVSAPAVEAINRQGGRLYVWPKKSRCCGGAITLEAATSPPAGKVFRRADGSASFELFLPTHLAPLPDELHVEARGRSGRIQAFWNGCAWVVQLRAGSRTLAQAKSRLPEQTLVNDQP